MKKNLISKLMGGGKLNAEKKSINDNQTTKIAQSNLKQQTHFFHSFTRKRHYVVCFLLLAGAALSIMESCRKPDDFLETASATNTTNNNPSVDLRSEDNDDKLMVLGARRKNPYTVEVMTEAWNKLYAPDVVALPATHLYIRFLPTSLEQYAQLGEYDFNLYDFPLEYEVREEGDFYHDPTIGADKMTWQYAVLKVGRDFPEDIQHEVIARLVLAPYRSALTEAAFRLTGNAYDSSHRPNEIHGTNPNGGGNPAGGGGSPVENPPPYDDPECTEGCPNYPCCEEPTIDCDDAPCTAEDPPAPCEPGGVNWPECLNTYTFSPAPTPFSECGCLMPNNERIPAGCIRVDDSQLGDRPVRDVKVITKDNWFTEDDTWTDEKGCWRMNKPYFGKMWVFVKFKNDRCVIRGLRNLFTINLTSDFSIPVPKLWEYSWAVEDYVGSINGPVFNNLTTLYPNSSDNNSAAKMFWYAATTNNALHEYHDYAAQDNIGTPPEDLDILLTNYDGAAAAPMLDDLQENPNVALSTGLLIVTLSSIVAEPTLTLSSITNTLSTYAAIWAPDVVYNYGDEINRPSDQFKAVVYHEFAHTAHFNAVNDDAFWIANIGHILFVSGNNLISNDANDLPSPYGNGSQSGSERCAIIEMWASTIGPIYTDKTYGEYHSVSNYPIGSLYQNQNRHLFALERFVPNNTFNEDSWIPKGLFLDCIDNNANNPNGVSDGVPTDNVNDYTIKQCFDAINNSPTQLSTVRNSLISVLPAGQNAVNVTSLFTQYGF